MNADHQRVAYNFRVSRIPEGTLIGFIGRPDDTPNPEESFAIEWNTLEHWDIPFSYAINAIHWRRPGKNAANPTICGNPVIP